MKDKIEKISIKAADVIADKKGEDIVIAYVGDLLGVTEYFVIATATNKVQAHALIDDVEKRLRNEDGRKPIGREGLDDGEWALLDYGDFVVHIFLPEAREFYRLENLWGDAPRIETQATKESQTGVIKEVQSK